MTVQTLEKRIAPLSPPISASLAHLLRISPPQPVLNRGAYRAYLKILEICLEALESAEVKGAQAHTLRKYTEVIRPLLAEYEKKEFPAKGATQAEVLEFLMEQNNLSQEDLSEDLGGQSAVSYILNGKRSLTAKQIERVSKRFQVSPSVFFPATREA